MIFIFFKKHIKSFKKIRKKIKTYQITSKSVSRRPALFGTLYYTQVCMFSKDEWIELRELMPLLGYSDERSIKKWCRDQKVPIIKMGLKKYIPSQFLTQYIDNQLVIFDKPRVVDLKTESVNTPKNEVISKYLEKYENRNISKITGKR